LSAQKMIGKGRYLKMALGIVIVAMVAGGGYSAFQTTQVTKPLSPVTAATTSKETTASKARLIVKWLGHSSYEIKASDKIIYIDPYVGEYEDKADIVLVTHSHSDHCDPSKIAKIRKDDTVVIAPADCASKIGGTINSLKPGEKTSVGSTVVEAIEAYNHKRFRSPGNPYHPKGLGVGYLLTIEDKTIYHAGDTDFTPEMKDLKNIYLALLPTGGTQTMDNPEAAEAALTFKPRFVMSMHRWNTDPNEFRKEVEAKSQIKVILLQPGEVFEAE